ncbi:hypothetical protein DP939_07020 [Spongiactinospora rosea]|uniref:Uncharacterized protein n=1 Tax=Spongiactinospora rosea TaxID=2248750 RepID=A0A366M3Q7_9ACTN|nr:hypothetical protein DP939_07020 [Spongiactinospora rosea]
MRQGKQSDSEMVDGLLLHLVENHFVRVLAQNADEIVYTFHELVRFFAQEQVERELSYPEESEEGTMELL